MKVVKVPMGLLNAPYYHNALTLDGLSIVESCTHTNAVTSRTGSMFLEEPILLVVLGGTNVLTHGKIQYVVRKNEMVLLKKATQLTYNKTGDPEKNYAYDSLLFFLKEEFIVDFMKMAHIESTATAETAVTMVKPVNERLLKFFYSVKPYFNDQEPIDSGLMRLKMLELLYDLTSTDKNFLQQLLQLKQQVYADIPSVVEENYANPVSLSDLAYLCGRSLSSFKRDFYAIYQTTPAVWIRGKRLDKAREMLQAGMPVKEVCYSLGFESPAHFSRLFKTHFGQTPSAVKPCDEAKIP
jgi:AraC-like DNA-binding protein